MELTNLTFLSVVVIVGTGVEGTHDTVSTRTRSVVGDEVSTNCVLTALVCECHWSREHVGVEMLQHRTRLKEAKTEGNKYGGRSKGIERREVIRQEEGVKKNKAIPVTGRGGL
jgi:hypothetical protein